jgi:hypothetical protein
MPFTPCHAAVAQPLGRWGLVTSAVAVGSMAPDFEYYLRLSLSGRWGHSPGGVLWFTLPAACAALWLFHAVLKRPLALLLPLPLYARILPLLDPFPFAPARRFARIVASLAAGIAAHLFVDACTHQHGLAVEWLPALQAPLVPIPWLVLPRYEALQYALSMALALWLAWQAWSWFRQAPACESSGAPLPAVRQFRIVAIAGFLAGTAALLYSGLSTPAITDLPSLRLFGGRLLVAGTSGFGVALSLLCQREAIRRRLVFEPARAGRRAAAGVQGDDRRGDIDDRAD